MDKVPVELASMVGDYDSVKDIETVNRINECLIKLSGDKLFDDKEMDYLENHDYEVKAVSDKGSVYVGKK